MADDDIEAATAPDGAGADVETEEDSTVADGQVATLAALGNERRSGVCSRCSPRPMDNRRPLDRPPRSALSGHAGRRRARTRDGRHLHRRRPRPVRGYPGPRLSITLGPEGSKFGVLKTLDEAGATIEDFSVEESSLEALFAEYTTAEQSVDTGTVGSSTASDAEPAGVDR